MGFDNDLRDLIRALPRSDICDLAAGIGLPDTPTGARTSLAPLVSIDSEGVAEVVHENAVAGEIAERFQTIRHNLSRLKI
jgi:hypothetical protein